MEELIDITLGLAVVKQNKTLYLRLLNNFIKSRLYEELMEAVRSGDAALSGSKAHALKGVAGNLRLTALHGAVEDYDRLVKSGSGAFAASPELARVTEAYEATAARIEAYNENPALLGTTV